MMLNRITGCVPSRGPPPNQEFYVLSTSCAGFLVSREMARAVVHQLQRWLRPRWIRVVDLAGSEVWLPSRSIEYIYESTPDQRAFERTLRRALDAEGDDDSPAVA